MTVVEILRAARYVLFPEDKEGCGSPPDEILLTNLVQETINNMLGLPKEDLDEATNVAIERQKRASVGQH